MAAGSAALRSNVGQDAAAQPTKGLAETMGESVADTSHSCVGGGEKEEREKRGLWLQDINSLASVTS